MSDDTKSLKIRVLNKIVDTVVSLVNKDIDIAELQEKYRATKGKVIQGRLTDVNKVFYLQIANGAVHRLKNPKKVDGWFATTTTTMVNIFRGKIKMMNPATGEERYEPYDPISAVRYGDIVVTGEATSADLLLFTNHIYKEVYPRLRKSLNGEVEKLEQEVNDHANR